MRQATLSSTFNSIHRSLFPGLEEELGVLTPSYRKLVETIEILDLRGITAYWFHENVRGRPRLSRLPLLKAFIAKHVLGLSATRQILRRIEENPSLRRLCGWEFYDDIPSEATFSRAFAEFAEHRVPTRLHEQLVSRYAGEQEEQARQLSYDSSDIPAREKAVDDETPRKSMPALEEQIKNALPDNLQQMPELCDIGTKRKGSNGHRYSWRGYKLHLAVTDGDIPIASLVSSASMHDSQAMIPLMQKAEASSFDWFCDLADAAYDAKWIKQYSRWQKRMAIIDHNPRRGEKREFNTYEKHLYKRRTCVERAFSQLKDWYGCARIFVRGLTKIRAHLSFGVAALSAKQIINRLE